MISQRQCPFCQAPSSHGCAHLALAAEGRDFVRRCVELCHGQRQWQALCQQCAGQSSGGGDGSPELDDFTWLETAFCERFLKRLSWFGGMEHEWRAGPKRGQGGFWILLWSGEPERLWWQLRDEFERQTHAAPRPARVRLS
jgi:hypothetical protein